MELGFGAGGNSFCLFVSQPNISVNNINSPITAFSVTYINLVLLSSLSNLILVFYNTIPLEIVYFIKYIVVYIALCRCTSKLACHKSAIKLCT